MKNKFFGLSVLLTTLVLIGCENGQMPTKVKVIDEIDEVNIKEVDLSILDNTVVLDQEDDLDKTNENDVMDLMIDPEVNPMVDPIVENIKTPKEIAASVNSFGINTPEYTRCLSDSMTMCQQTAVQEEIQKTNSVKPCNYLGDDEAKASCRDNAWMSLAMANNDLNSCESITEESMKNSCLSSVSVQVAIKSGSAVGCKGIEDTELQKQCQNSVYQGLAIKNLDTTICNKIVSDFEGEIDMCKDMVKMEKEMAEQNAKMEEEMKKDQARMEKEMAEQNAKMEEEMKKDQEMIEVPPLDIK